MDQLSPLMAFLVVLGILTFLFVWIFLPFAVFGIKPILRDIANRLAAIERNQLRP